LALIIAWPEILGTAIMKTLDHEVVLHLSIKSAAAQLEVRSMAYQMKAARFPAHRNLVGFEFEQAHVDKALVKKLHDLQFIDTSQNVVLLVHPTTSLGIQAVRAKGKRVRFFSTVELVNALELEKSQSKHGQLA
jgi:DNA replication protein DnaC